MNWNGILIEIYHLFHVSPNVAPHVSLFSLIYEPHAYRASHVLPIQPPLQVLISLLQQDALSLQLPILILISLPRQDERPQLLPKPPNLFFPLLLDEQFQRLPLPPISIFLLQQDERS